MFPYGSGVGPACTPAAEGVALDDHEVAVPEGCALVHVLLAPVPRLHLRARLRLALRTRAHAVKACLLAATPLAGPPPCMPQAHPAASAEHWQLELRRNNSADLGASPSP